MINNYDWSPSALERFAEREKVKAHQRRNCNNKIAYLTSPRVNGSSLSPEKVSEIISSIHS